MRAIPRLAQRGNAVADHEKSRSQYIRREKLRAMRRQCPLIGTKALSDKLGAKAIAPQAVAKVGQPGGNLLDGKSLGVPGDRCGKGRDIRRPPRKRAFNQEA